MISCHRKPQTAVVCAMGPARVACFRALGGPAMGQSILAEQEGENGGPWLVCSAHECGRKLRAYSPPDLIFVREEQEWPLTGSW